MLVLRTPNSPDRGGGEMEEVVRIIGNLPILTEQQIIHAFEFFWVNPYATFAHLYHRLYCIVFFFIVVIS